MSKLAKVLSCVIIAAVTILLGAHIFSLLSVSASEVNRTPNVSSYELEENSDYYYGETMLVGDMTFGSPTAGDFVLSGSLSEKTTFRGTEAYGVTGNVVFNYEYNDPVLCQEDADEWDVYSNSDKTVNGISLGAKMKQGAIIIQKSTNKQIWNTEHIATDVFDDPNTNVLEYSPSEADLRTGMYYRVIVAYEIRHEKSSFLFVTKYEYKECVEVYEFYLANATPSVVVKEIISGSEIQDSESVEYGFRIDSGNSGNLISVKAPGADAAVSVTTAAAFYDPGVYTINEITKFGLSYTTSVTVEKGLNTEAVKSLVYQSENNAGYEVLEALKVESTVFGADSYTGLKLVVPKENEIQKQAAARYSVFGIDGTEVYVLLKTNPQNLGEDWVISDDAWGGTEGQTVNGITTGKIGSGAIIVQKSSDGYNWQLCSEGAYSNGIFTTDYENIFGIGSETCIYTPAGDDINKGCVYRIFYAYEVRNIKTNQYKNIVEVYTFKLLNSNLNAVTFHNLTLSGDVSDLDKEGEEIIAELQKSSETLTDGALTVTGFEIDTSLNSAIDIKVRRNGVQYSIPEDGKIVENGMYEITISNELGDRKQIVIYVCGLSMEQMYEKLFGTAFLTGKRIFSYYDLPVYEGMLTQLNLNALGFYDPLTSVVIVNETTGQTKTVSFETAKKTVVLEDAGRYTVSIYTNQTMLGREPSGDNHSFVFQFDLIAYGTAPGPVVNEDSLQKYGTSNSPSNAYPVYYGVSYLSASKGYITLAFANWQDAYDYVYEHEAGMVELQPDGVYRYNGNFFVSQKEKYTSGWDLTDAIDFFTRLAIKEAAFDLSDEFTYLTLTAETIGSVENLRTLELDKSVVVFADEKQQDAILSSIGLPIINSKKYAYLMPGMEGAVDRGYHHFEFIKDTYGYDSFSVMIVDCNGARYNVAYNKSVGDQLAEFGCPTGIITIEERTVYGDTNTYQALYIAEGENTISFDLKYSIGGEAHTKRIASVNDGESITVNFFCLDNVLDQLGDVGIIKVYDGKREDVYSTDNVAIKNTIYATAGTYEITVVNRLGYKYTFTVKIETSNYYVINIYGENSDEPFSFVYTDGGMISLPELTKYGYNHSGFMTEDGTFVSKQVASILLKGHTALEAVWEAKKYNVNLYVEGALYSTATVAFGESYELPTLSSRGDTTFIGWGAELLNGTITLTEEGDVSLVACFRSTAVDEPEDEPEDKNEDETTDDATDEERVSRPKVDWRWILVIVGAVILWIFLPGAWFLWLALIVVAVIGLVFKGGLLDSILQNILDILPF